MADWSLPTLSSTYTNFLSQLQARDTDLALQFDGTTSSNIPTGAIRWTSSANTWQKWSGSAWGALSSTFAFPAITVSGVATLTGGGTSTTPAADNNTTNIATTAFVIGQASGTAPVMDGTAAIGSSLRYARQDHVHPTDTSRAPLASPSFTGTASFAGDVNLTGSGYLDLPAGTTAQRPGSPSPGMIRYNSDLSQFEGYGSAWGAIGGSGSGVNALINGNPIINQRAYVSGTATSAANQYTLDRWRVVTSGQFITWSDSGNVRTVTAPSGGVEQVIEGLNLLTGTYTLSWTGTAVATIGGASVSNGGTVSITGGADTTLRFSSGTFSKAQLQFGNFATTFEQLQRLYGVELALCQRYYIQDFAESGAVTLYPPVATTTNQRRLWVPFPVRMRVAPTISSLAVSNIPSPSANGYISGVQIFGAASSDIECYVQAGNASAEL